MKKIIFALTFLICTASFGQNFSGGIKAGANFSNFRGGDFDAVKKKAIVGFHGGGFLSFSFGALSLQPELLVSTQGARIDSANKSYDWKVTYATVPVILKYRTATGFYLEAGPQVGFKLSESVSDETIEDFAKGLDLSAAAGVGFQTKGGLGIGARYLVGLSKVGDFDPPKNIDPDFKNSVIQVGAFITLGK
ncbi:MAG TPA: porin family protein [Chitinophagaceae bacterium]|nr:porin family protein [Chitinophagaceae bacterium]